ncbi:MAG: hypothetical protein H0Z37_09120 [Firmicutes bacterium]|nr:hypothetical protein [Bacillota bacterium]
MEAWYREAKARCGDSRRAAVILGQLLATSVVHLWLVPVLAENRLPLADFEASAFHVHDDGWIDAVAVDTARMAVLPHDPATGEPGVTVIETRDDLLSLAVEQLLAIERSFECIRSVCRIGRPFLWGSLLDTIGAQALAIARMTGSDRWRAWREAEDIMERVRVACPGLNARPRPFAVSWIRGEELFLVRGTCCLHYRTVQGAEPNGHGYCNGCPLRTDESRASNFIAYLERTNGD